MYDQRWSDDWIAARARRALQGSDLRRHPRRRWSGGCRTAARAARRRRARGTVPPPRPGPGWDADGLELNPKTAAYAASASGGRVHQGNLYTWSRSAPVLRRGDADRRARAHSGSRSRARRARTICCEPERLDRRSRCPTRRPARQGSAARAAAPVVPPTLADNLVHVNHFSAASSLRGRSTATAFATSRVMVGAPELPDGRGRAHAHRPTGARSRVPRARASCRAAPPRRSRSTSRRMAAAPDSARSRRRSASSFRRSTTKRCCGECLDAWQRVRRRSDRAHRRRGRMPRRHGGLTSSRLAATPWGTRHLRWIHQDDAHELRCTNRGHRAARGRRCSPAWQDDMFLRAAWLVPEVVARRSTPTRELGLLSLSRGLNCIPVADPIATLGGPGRLAPAAEHDRAGALATGSACRKWTS